MRTAFTNRLKTIRDLHMLEKSRENPHERETTGDGTMAFAPFLPFTANSKIEVYKDMHCLKIQDSNLMSL
jgi:hypothetical protein